MHRLIKCLRAAGTILALSPLSVSHAAAPPDATAVVTVSGGQVAGYTRHGVLEFRGIPYGDSVAGEHRWQLPRPAPAWDGVLPAMHFGPACAQAARYNLTERSDSEDCLTLNVSTPLPGTQATSSARPVLVWIHGGAFIGGASSLYRLDELVKRTDAVVVTMNYRLGVFGFMPHPAFDAAQNGGYALEDQRLALRWVQENIAAFGGNPDDITLAGESAGAASVCMHLISPEHTTGLFHKAIVQSAACVSPLQTVAARTAFGQQVAARAGCDHDETALSCLRSKSVQDLIQAGDEASTGELMAFAPSYGNATLPRSGIDALQSGTFVKVPVLNGGTRDELSLYLAYDIQAGKQYTAQNYLAVLETLYGQHAQDVAAQYPVADYPSVPQALSTLMSNFRPDLGLNHCLYVEASRLLARHVPVYHWEFADRQTPVLGVAIPAQPDPGFPLGATHSSELNAFFPYFSNTTTMSAPDLPAASQAMAVQMLDTWAQFIRTGQPAAQGIPTWPPYGEAQRAVRFEPGNVHAFDPVADYRCTFWQTRFPDSFAR